MHYRMKYFYWKNAIASTTCYLQLVKATVEAIVEQPVGHCAFKNDSRNSCGSIATNQRVIIRKAVMSVSLVFACKFVKL